MSSFPLYLLFSLKLWCIDSTFFYLSFIASFFKYHKKYIPGIFLKKYIIPFFPFSSSPAISTRMIDRIFSGAVTRGTAQKEGKMSYTEFVWYGKRVLI